MKSQKLLMELGKFTIETILMAIFVLLYFRVPEFFKFMVAYMGGYIVCDVSNRLRDKIKSV